jgi:hypothetical protein
MSKKLSKKDRLTARAKQTTRRPEARRLLDATTQKQGYRVVGFSLYTPEAQFIDQVTQTLKRAGNPKANRSLVVREAILRLQQELQSKTPQEILQDFAERQAWRQDSGMA